jgi:alpha-L-rhamnosidase
VTVTNLRCDYQVNPIGLAAAEPRFGWELGSDEQGLLQSRYQIQLAEAGPRAEPDFSSPAWDTGWAESRVSLEIPYGGPALAPRTSYLWRVRIDTTTGETDWSEPAWFETSGLAEPWVAPFVGCPALDDPDESHALYLRREFSLPESASEVRIYASALGVYELQVNGSPVGDAVFAPGWTNYHKRIAYQTYDVSDLIRPGANVVGAVLGPGWFKGDLTWLNARNLYGQHLGLTLELRADGEPLLQTDDRWKVSHGAIVYSEFYHGETCDNRKDLGDWSVTGYDDSAWKPAKEIAFDKTRLVPQDGPYVRRQERIAPVKLITTPRGERVIDFGQNITGWVSFSVRGDAGQRVVLHHAEVLDADGNFYTENLRSARNTIEYTLSGGSTERYEPHFSFQGFRYVEIVEYPGDPDLSAFEAVVVGSEMEPTFDFECSNDLLNQLHHNILWGWKGNSVDVPTDCPQRDERLGWTGDAQVFVGTAAYLADVRHFFRKWLRDMASEQLPGGGVPFVIPDVLTPLADQEPMMKESHSSTGWGDAMVICPWTIFSRYGDQQLLSELYPAMRAWVEFIREQAGDDLLWNTGFHFGDWVALDAKEGSFFGATPNDLTATAYFAYSTDLLAKAASALGKTDDEKRYSALREDIVRAFRREFYTPGGRLAARTQTAHVLALAFNLVPDENRGRTVEDLVALIHENEDALTTGFLGTPYLCQALADNGRLDLAYQLLLRTEYPSWLYQVTRGATTIWEHWDGLKPDGTMWSAQMNSFNHYAYGAVGEWMYRTVAGIDLTGANGDPSRFRLAPRPGGDITWCTSWYRSLYGELSLSWKIHDGQMHITATVPPNTTAELVLEGEYEPRQLLSGRHEIVAALPKSAPA